MIIDKIKLQLDLAMYKDKTRLRQWYPIVLGHMKEIESTQNNLADKVTKENEEFAQAISDEAKARENADDKLKEAVKDEARQREMLGKRVTTDIEDMGQIIALPDEGGEFNASDTEAIGNAPQERLFKLYNDTGAELTTIQTGSVLWTMSCALPAGAAAVCMKSNISGHLRILVLADNIATTEDIVNALESYYTSSDVDRIVEKMQTALDELKENGTGGGISGTLATPEMIHEMMKNATPDVYVPDGVTIGLATDEQIKEICN